MAKRQMVIGKPEQRETQSGGHRCGNLEHSALHEACARFRQVHISAGDECWVERRIVSVAAAFDIFVRYREHAGLPVAFHRHTGHPLQALLRVFHIRSLRLPVVATMSRHLMPLVDYAVHDFRCIRCKCGGAEECGPDLVLFQDIQDARCAVFGNGHGILKRYVHTAFAWHIELFGIETQ